MPSSIPYDPSLVLANVVHPVVIDAVTAVAKAQAPADAAEEQLNSLIAMRRSFDMTKMELMNLGIPVDDMQSDTDNLNKQITDAAKAYAKAKIAAEKAIQPLRAKIQAVHADVESPVDYVRTGLKNMPLAADTLNMDVQFFTLDQNNQDSSSFASTVASYVAASTDWLGRDASVQMSRAAAKQVSQQVQNHDIVGTLVLSCSCTHRNATMLAPFALNVDKGIRVWNTLFPNNKIRMNDPNAVDAVARQDSTADEQSFSIISGVTYGSSFVGMVHVLNTTDTSVSERVSSVASKLQAQMDAGGWFAKVEGGFGVDKSFANDVKNLLSAQNITSHVTLISMGILPSIVASDVKYAVQQFAAFDPKSSMDTIMALQQSTQSAQSSITDAAQAARTGGQLVSLKEATVNSVLSSLAPIDDGSNKILDHCCPNCPESSEVTAIFPG